MHMGIGTWTSSGNLYWTWIRAAITQADLAGGHWQYLVFGLGNSDWVHEMNRLKGACVIWFDPSSAPPPVLGFVSFAGEVATGATRDDRGTTTVVVVEIGKMLYQYGHSLSLEGRKSWVWCEAKLGHINQPVSAAVLYFFLVVLVFFLMFVLAMLHKKAGRLPTPVSQGYNSKSAR